MTGTLKSYKGPTKLGGAYRRAKAKTGNFTSARGTRADDGTKFGKPNAPKVRNRPRYTRRNSAAFGGLVGTTVGGTVGSVAYDGQANRDQRVAEELEYQRRINKSRTPRPTLITDLGSPAVNRRARYNFKRESDRWPLLSRPAAAAGLAAGGAGSVSFAAGNQKASRKSLDRKYKHKTNREALARVSKADVTLERYRPNKQERRKLRATESGQSAAIGAGTGAGLVAGRNLMQRGMHIPKEYRSKIKTKGNAKFVAAAAGLGAVSGAAGKYEKDQYRVKVHKSSVSAFGVDHG